MFDSRFTQGEGTIQTNIGLRLALERRPWFDLDGKEGGVGNRKSRRKATSFY